MTDFFLFLDSAEVSLPDRLFFLLLRLPLLGATPVPSSVPVSVSVRVTVSVPTAVPASVPGLAFQLSELVTSFTIKVVPFLFFFVLLISKSEINQTGFEFGS